MAFKNQIYRSFMKAFLMPLVVFVISLTFFFNRSFNNYLLKQHEEKTKRFEWLTSQLLLNDLAQDRLDQLLFAISEAKVDIRYYDPNQQLVYEFISPQSSQHPLYVVERTKEVVSGHRVLGHIRFSYYDKEILSPATESLFNTLIFSTLFSGLFYLIAGFIFSTFFSRNIAGPIALLSEKTRLIKDGHYHFSGQARSDIRAINQLSKDLDFLASKLERQKQIRKDYSQDIAHELRTPITNVQLHLEAIQDGLLEANGETLGVILEEIHRLKTLIDNLKNTFDDEIDMDQVHQSSFLVNDLLEDLVQALGPQFTKQGVDLVLKAPLALEITSDRDKLQAILLNFLTNALKASPSQAGAQVVLAMEKTRDKLLLSVQDQGLGISQEDQEKIFERFYRVDSARNTKNSGYGLGLSICKSQADILGAKILVNSQPGFGSEFILALGLDQVQALEVISGEG